MSIERLSQHEAARTYLQSAEGARAASAPTPSDADAQPGVVRRADSVSLSADARALAAARAAVLDAPDTRQPKVAEVKQRVEDGTYSVPAHVLARKLIDASNHS